MSITQIINTIQYVAILILFAELVYALCQKPSEMQKHVIVLTVSTIMMFIGYIIEINAENEAEAMAGVTIAYLGKPFIMVASFLFICVFFDVAIGKKGIIAMTLWGTIFPVLVFSNKYHHLYYQRIEFNEAKPYTPLIITRGPLYYLYIITSVVFFIACIFVIVSGYKNSKLKHRTSLTIYSILMIVSAITGYAIYLTGLSNEYDATMLGVFGSAIFLSLIFIRCKVFDPLSLAKDYALSDSAIGLLVIDPDKEIVYQNDTMVSMLKEIPVAYLKSLQEPFATYTAGNKTYSIHKKDLQSDDMVVGESIEVSDITETYNYQTILEESVKERTSRIEEIQRTIIASVANIVEARSVETGEHIKRTSYYSELIARKLKNLRYFQDILTDEYIANIADAAPLHDIGKIAVPDSILLKPGKLTEDEFEIMKIHTTVGADIIEKSMRGLEDDDYIQLAEDIALYHHEAIDGSGYPYGIKGDEIPLSARIVTVADCYDALISERSYKRAFTQEEAIAAILEKRSSTFDDRVVDAFIQALTEQ